MSRTVSRNVWRCSRSTGTCSIKSHPTRQSLLTSLSTIMIVGFVFFCWPVMTHCLSCVSPGILDRATCWAKLASALRLELCERLLSSDPFKYCAADDCLVSAAVAQVLHQRCWRWLCHEWGARVDFVLFAEVLPASRLTLVASDIVCSSLRCVAVVEAMLAAALLEGRTCFSEVVVVWTAVAASAAAGIAAGMEAGDSSSFCV